MLCQKCFRDLPESYFYENRQQCKTCLNEVRAINWRKNQLKNKNNSKDLKGFNKVKIEITFEKEIPSKVLEIIQTLKEMN